jgi:hypothetical protein
LGYLSWYQLARSGRPWIEAPELEVARAATDVQRNGVGTLPPSQITRIRPQLLGTIDVAVTPPPTKEAIRVTASDISAGNLLSEYAPRGTYPGAAVAPTIAPAQLSGLRSRLRNAPARDRYHAIELDLGIDL